MEATAPLPLALCNCACAWVRFLRMETTEPTRALCPGTIYAVRAHPPVGTENTGVPRFEVVAYTAAKAHAWTVLEDVDVAVVAEADTRAEREVVLTLPRTTETAATVVLRFQYLTSRAVVAPMTLWRLATGAFHAHTGAAVAPAVAAFDVKDPLYLPKEDVWIYRAGCPEPLARWVRSVRSGAAAVADTTGNDVPTLRDVLTLPETGRDDGVTVWRADHLLNDVPRSPPWETTSLGPGHFCVRDRLVDPADPASRAFCAAFPSRTEMVCDATTRRPYVNGEAVELMYAFAQVRDDRPVRVARYDPSKACDPAVLKRVRGVAAHLAAEAERTKARLRDRAREANQYYRDTDENTARVFLTTYDANGLRVTLQVPYRPYVRVLRDPAWSDAQVSAAVAFLGERSGAPRGSVVLDRQERLRHFMGFEPDRARRGEAKLHQYLRVSFPSVATRARAVRNLKQFWKNEPQRVRLPNGDVHRLRFQGEELDITPLAQFQADFRLTANTWFRLRGPGPAASPLARASYQRITEGGLTSHAEEELVVPSFARAVEVLPDRNDVPPLLDAAYDIETLCDRGEHYFTNPHEPNDEVYIVGVTFRWKGAVPAAFRRRFAHTPALANLPPDTTFARISLVSRPCEALPGTTVVELPSEAALLLATRDLLVGWAGADATEGWNNSRFDDRFLYERAARLPAEQFAAFRHLGRVVQDQRDLLHAEFRRKHVSIDMLFMERFSADGYIFDIGNKKRDQHTLNAVAADELGRQKDPVNVRHINAAGMRGRATGADVAKVAAYCVRDAELAGTVCDKLGVFGQLFFLAKLAALPFDEYVTAQSMKQAEAAIFHALRAEFGMVWNRMGRPFWDGSVTGGTVMCPSTKYVRGDFEDALVMILDFQGLYPSEIMTYNIDPSTILVTPEDRRVVEAFGWTTERIDTPNAPEPAATFVAGRCRGSANPASMHGVLPTKLLAMRNGRQAIKNRAKKFPKDSTEARRLDCQQLAFKLFMNSFYGVMAAPFGALSCLMAGAAITSRGGELLRACVEFVENEFDWRAAGLSAAPRVDYGDTDSIMVLLRGSTVAPILRAGEDISEQLTARFSGEVVLENENAAIRAIFGKSKTYAYLAMEPKALAAALRDFGVDVAGAAVRDVWRILRHRATGASLFKRTIKGMKPVRRDIALALRGVIERAVHVLLNTDDENAFQAALNTVCTGLRPLVHNALPLDQYVTTVNVKEETAYKDNRIPGIGLVVAWAKERAVAGSCPRPGDRLPWVVGTRADPQRLTRPDTLPLPPGGVTWKTVAPRDKENGEENPIFRTYNPEEMTSVCPVDRTFYLRKQLLGGLKSGLFLVDNAVETIVRAAVDGVRTWDERARRFHAMVAASSSPDGAARAAEGAPLQITELLRFGSAAKARAYVQERAAEARTRWTPSDLVYGPCGEPSLTEEQAEFMNVPYNVHARVSQASVESQQRRVNDTKELRVRACLTGEIQDGRFKPRTDKKKAAAARKRRNDRERESWKRQAEGETGGKGPKQPRISPKGGSILRFLASQKT